MLKLKTLLVSPNVTFLPESEGGVLPSDLLDGLMKEPSGLEAVPANHSPQQEKQQEPTTSVTSGRCGSTSSASASLASSLVSRLKQQLTTDGSILFKMTWKEKVTPSGRSVSLLRASVPRTSGRGYGSWPTPTSAPVGNNVDLMCSGDGRKTPNKLGWAAALASWPTPTQTDAIRSPSENFTTPNITLNHAAVLAGWVTPTTREGKDSPGMATTGKDGRSRLDQLPRQAQLLDFGETPSGSPARTENRGQLNPQFSRWLMGYPDEWGNSAPTATPSSRKSARKS